MTGTILRLLLLLLVLLAARRDLKPGESLVQRVAALAAGKAE